MILMRFTLILILLLSISSVCLAQTDNGDGAIFKVERLNALILLIVFSFSVLYYISRAKRGSDLFIRKLPGLEAVDEAVGRATEMGRSVLFIPGIQDLDDIQTIAGLSILNRVASVTAQYETPLLVPILYPLAFAAGQEVVRQAYINAGKAEHYRDDMVRYIAGEQFAYAAAVNGIMTRDKPAANIFMGAFYAESLLLAETGNATGAIQIAGTANPEQLPFFIAACDYTIMGEELYAASAYLSREPLLLGSLKGQDLVKIAIVGVMILGAILVITGLDAEFLVDLFVTN
ncbi:MAG: hypothetical protein KKH67_03335 [candidate division Zixibacteria bacterium]|nr:hypothetical protein [candidate division Zixibacteria bacterium]MBU1470502.1 hypothetical protein [candidate division Zixibacteria bacterium]